MKIDCHMHVNGRHRKWGWDDNETMTASSKRTSVAEVIGSGQSTFPKRFDTHTLPIVADVTWNGQPLGEIAEAVAYW